VVNSLSFLERKENLEKKELGNWLAKRAGLRTLWLSAFACSNTFFFFKKKEKPVLKRKNRKNKSRPLHFLYFKLSRN